MKQFTQETRIANRTIEVALRKAGFTRCEHFAMKLTDKMSYENRGKYGLSVQFDENLTLYVNDKSGLWGKLCGGICWSNPFGANEHVMFNHQALQLLYGYLEGIITRDQIYDYGAAYHHLDRLWSEMFDGKLE